MEKYKSNYFIYTLILVSFFISACTPQKQHFPKDLEPQQVNILRFDQDFLSMKQEPITRSASLAMMGLIKFSMYDILC